MPEAGELPGPRWVLGEPQSWASDWVSLLDEPEAVHAVSDEDFEAHGVPFARRMARSRGLAGRRLLLWRRPSGSDGREGSVAVHRLRPGAGLPQDRACAPRVPVDGGDSPGHPRRGESARRRAAGSGPQHGHGDRRGSRDRFPTGRPGRCRRSGYAGPARPVRSARAGARGSRAADLGAEDGERPRAVLAARPRRGSRVPACPGQPRTDRGPGDEDLRAPRVGAGGRGGRGARGGAQLPRRHGHARSPAGAGVRALGARAGSRHGGRRRRSPRRAARAALRDRR